MNFVIELDMNYKKIMTQPNYIPAGYNPGGCGADNNYSNYRGYNYYNYSGYNINNS